MGKIHIKCIKTPDNFYFYDRTLDVVCKVTSSEFEALREVEVRQNIKGYEETLKRLTEQGLLKESVAESLRHPDTDNIQFFTNNHLTTLVLQLTQQCNFRCSYCVYGGNYYTREHSNQKLTWETAKKSLDFFAEKSRGEQESSICFYGGQPLLEFELIKKIVDYSEVKLKHRILSFSMTTNGDLLNDDNIDYIVKHNFRIMISLDGGESTHNANRRLKGGQPTFKKVYDNIINIKRKYPDFFNSRMTYNSVFSNSTDVEEALGLFADSGVFFCINESGLQDSMYML